MILSNKPEIKYKEANISRLDLYNKLSNLKNEKSYHIDNTLATGY
jgi:hypothetical protein